MARQTSRRILAADIESSEGFRITSRRDGPSTNSITKKYVAGTRPMGLVLPFSTIVTMDGCESCASGAAVKTRSVLIGQAPGPREGSFGRPFAWTAGKTLFSWFESILHVNEQTFRERVYISAVARCFPGKAKAGGDRRPSLDEIQSCQ